MEWKSIDKKVFFQKKADKICLKKTLSDGFYIAKGKIDFFNLWFEVKNNIVVKGTQSLLTFPIFQIAKVDFEKLTFVNFNLSNCYEFDNGAFTELFTDFLQPGKYLAMFDNGFFGFSVSNGARLQKGRLSQKDIIKDKQFLKVAKIEEFF